MPSSNDVTDRIKQWATALGGDQMQRLGYAAIEAIRGERAANDPDCSIDPNLIEDILASMAEDGFVKQARVLRVHYLAPGLSEADRLQRLRREGLSLSRAAYYIYLDAAHAYVSGALSFGGDPCAS